MGKQKGPDVVLKMSVAQNRNIFSRHGITKITSLFVASNRNQSGQQAPQIFNLTPKKTMSTTDDLLRSLRILLHTTDAAPNLADTIERLQSHRTLVHDMTQEHAERIARLDARERGSQARKSKIMDKKRAKLQAEEVSEQAVMRVS